VLSMSPFLKLDEPEMDFLELCESRKLPKYIENQDIFKGVSLSQHNWRFVKMTKVIFIKNVNYILTCIGFKFR
jgi:hypothetical protein